MHSKYNSRDARNCRKCSCIIPRPGANALWNFNHRIHAKNTDCESGWTVKRAASKIPSHKCFTQRDRKKCPNHFPAPIKGILSEWYGIEHRPEIEVIELMTPMAFEVPLSLRCKKVHTPNVYDLASEICWMFNDSGGKRVFRISYSLIDFEYFGANK